MHSDFSDCCVHESETDTDESAQILTKYIYFFKRRERRERETDRQTDRDTYTETKTETETDRQTEQK